MSQAISGIDEFVVPGAAAQPPKGLPTVDVLLPVILCPAIALFFVATDLRLLHWFMIPVVLSGMLIIPDAIRWKPKRNLKQIVADVLAYLKA
jgi:hypothetical protein